MRKNYLLLLAIFLFQSRIFAQLPPYLTAGASAWYPFDNNTNDLSGQNQNLLSSGVTFAPDRYGVANSAASFNGTSNYLTLGNFPNAANGGFVISAWVKIDNSQGPTQSIVQLGKYTASSNQSRVFLTTNGGSFYANSYNVSQLYSLNTPSPDSVWTHVAVEYDGASFYLYENGAVVQSVIMPQPNNPVCDLTIGASYVSGALGNFYKGLIDDVVVYNTILPACKVNEMYRSCVLDSLGSVTADVGGTATFQAPITCWDSAGITYQWQLNAGTGFQNLSNIGQFSGATSPTLSISNLSIAQNHLTQFKCLLTYGCGPAKSTSAAVLTVTQPSGLNDVEQAGAFSISPNPATNEMVLSVSANLVNKPYRIFNTIGQQVVEGKIVGEKTNVDLSSLPMGVYSVQLPGNSSKQLVISK